MVKKILDIPTAVQEMSEQEAVGLSFLRLATPLLGVLVKASAKLRESEQEKL